MLHLHARTFSRTLLWRLHGQRRQQSTIVSWTIICKYFSYSPSICGTFGITSRKSGQQCPSETLLLLVCSCSSSSLCKLGMIIASDRFVWIYKWILTRHRCLYWFLLFMEKFMGGTLWRDVEEHYGDHRWHFFHRRGRSAPGDIVYLQAVDNPEYVEIDSATMVSMATF